MHLDQYDIYLVGMPGAGKSTVGRAIAEILDRDFVDLDDHIERLEGRSIKEIFFTDGESHFRELEAVYLRKIPDTKGGQVIATGGGTPCFANNTDFINSRGVSVYLKVPSETLAKRLRNNLEQRPLITTNEGSELIEHLDRTLAQREVFYHRASLISTSDNPITILGELRKSI